MTKVDVWMPFYVGDYLAGTMHLNTEQHGCYVLLILACWKAGGALPDDEAQLAAIVRLPLQKWRAHGAVLRAFFTVEDGKLVHRRVASELANARQLSAKRSEAGKRGGRPKKLEPNKSDTQSSAPATGKQTESNSLSVAEANGKQTETPSQSHSPTTSSPNGDVVEAGDAGPSPDLGMRPCPHEAIVNAYHELLPMGRRVREWTPARQASLRARWREKPERQTLSWWRKFFAYVGESPFLTGKVSSPGRGPYELCLEWLTKSANLVNVIEGKYHNDQQGGDE